MVVHQSIERPIGVNVHGSHVLRTEPDRAEVEVAVVRLAPNPAVTFEQTSKAVEAVRKALRDGGVEDAEVEVSRVQLETAFQFTEGHRKLSGYQARVGFRFLVKKLDDVEKLLTAAVAAGANEVRSVHYQTTKLRELRTEARKAAVAAARKKAEVYCEAAGVKLGGVIHIEDVRPHAGLHEARGHVDAARTPEDDSEDAGSGLKPGSLAITAAVVITFGFLPD